MEQENFEHGEHEAAAHPGSRRSGSRRSSPQAPRQAPAITTRANGFLASLKHKIKKAPLS